VPERNPDSGHGDECLTEDAKEAIEMLMLGAKQHETYADELRALAQKIAHPRPGVETWVGMNGSRLTIEFRTEWDPVTMGPKYKTAA